MTKFLQCLESSGKFRKKFFAKYTEGYILVLILWKTNRGVHSTTDKKIEENLPKMTKITYLPNFRNVWNIKANFGKTFSLKYTKVYIIRNTILLGFHCFSFHENILFASEVIGLLVTVGI